MTTQALYNKWRGQTFDDILGQQHITQTLRNQIKAGRVGHAYLFTGLRGTGKTSTARIMAKAVNCVGDTGDPPCNRCHICETITAGRSLDLVEIDAASNRGIDEIRDLRERVAFAPHECRYKVYVIDEVHMLTNEAFNALLKTLEEPPAHIVFILCTTEPHRLPDTILSRCQRYDFRRGTFGVIVGKLRRIADDEDITITDDALDYVARRASGSFRDAESLLDQLAAYGDGEITLDLVHDVLGAVPSALVTRLVTGLVQGNVVSGLRAISDALDNGAEPRQFLGQILDHLRALMLIGVGSTEHLTELPDQELDELGALTQIEDFSMARVIRAIKLFGESGQELRTAARPRLPLELALVESTLTIEAPTEAPPRSEPGAHRSTPDSAPSASPERDSSPRETRPPEPVRSTADASSAAVADSYPSKTAQTQPKRVAKPPPSQPPATHVELQPPPVEPAQDAPSVPRLTLEWVQGHWSTILIKTKPRDSRVRALLNSAYPVAVKGDVVVLGCEAAFHREKLAAPDVVALVEEIMSEVLGMACRVQCEIGTQRPAAPSRGDAPPPARSDLFAGTSSPRERLLNHPAVQELQRLGGQVTNVQIYGDDTQQEDGRG